MEGLGGIVSRLRWVWADHRQRLHCNCSYQRCQEDAAYANQDGKRAREQCLWSEIPIANCQPRYERK